MKKQRQHPEPRFKNGQTVFNSLSRENMIVQGEPVWNGLVWMYAFENTDMRAGEEYLSHKQ